MEHDVNYTGKLFLEKPLTEEQIEKFEESKKENNDDYKWLYAVKYINDESGAYFEIDNLYKKLRPFEVYEENGKMLERGVFKSLARYIKSNNINIKIAKDSYIASHSLDPKCNCFILGKLKQLTEDENGFNVIEKIGIFDALLYINNVRGKMVGYI